MAWLPPPLATAQRGPNDKQGGAVATTHEPYRRVVHHGGCWQAALRCAADASSSIS